MSYVTSKVHPYGTWTPQQLNDLILLAYQLRQAEQGADWVAGTSAMLSAVDGITAILDKVGDIND